jgi:2-polyprenyl-3-methyl-5-hydroxy-6-metoxy-1,4-benzoquinol methylase
MADTLDRQPPVRAAVLVIGPHPHPSPWADQCALPASPQLRILICDVLQGSGGNKKAGLRAALEDGCDIVAVCPGDQPEALREMPRLIETLARHPEVDALVVPAAEGPLLRCATLVQNALLGWGCRGWHSGVRAYRARLLSQIAFDLNTNDDHFDTEILLQLLARQALIREQPLPAVRRAALGRRRTRRHALEAIKATIKYRLQAVNLLYDLRYHPEALDGAPADGAGQTAYREKFDSTSPHALAARDDRLVPPRSRVLDVGCATGYLGGHLTEAKGCTVVGVDVLEQGQVDRRLAGYHRIDLDTEPERLLALLRREQFDRVLLLDVIEHLARPEQFLSSLTRLQLREPPTFVVSTGNVAFVFVRLMLLLGHFNYGQKGILDITHRRLFSHHTFRNLLIQTGFVVSQVHYCPLPFRELGLSKASASLLERINMFCIRLRPRLFAYQVLFVAQPLLPPRLAPPEVHA